MSEMVNIRAIVRVEMLDRVVQTLKESGCPRLTVTRVHAIGSGMDPTNPKYGFDEGSAYVDKAQVQFVCGAERSEMFSELIARAARTGNQGDGIVYVHPVDRVVKIRTGKTGLAALR